MDTLFRHKSFLLTGVFLLCSSYFTSRVDHTPTKAGPVPVEPSHYLNAHELLSILDPSMEQLKASIATSTSTIATHGPAPDNNNIGETLAKTNNPHLDSNCVFCKIVAGDLPSFKVYETKHSLAFLARPPVAHGHTLIIPKYHSRTLTSDPGVPDEFLADIGPIMKKIAVMNGESAFNVIQNNGRTAWQSVDHVHFHVVPKPESEHTRGLVLSRESWPSFDADDAQCARDAEQMKRVGRDHGFPEVAEQDLSRYGI